MHAMQGVWGGEPLGTTQVYISNAQADCSQNGGSGTTYLHINGFWGGCLRAVVIALLLPWGVRNWQFGPQRTKDLSTTVLEAAIHDSNQ